ncbi:hypothetical protein [Streptomyces sp. NPDC051569]|uniref:hypothetical protein n=1 Tax=Streptomyces sp. NPDC051569 TaxID=3365661 RepID=UPI0037B81940
MPLDPRTSAEDHDEDPARPGPATAAGPGTAAAGAGDEPIRTLLWTAATIRPLEEVAALVSLLKRTGEVPSPGDEALRAAAVSRPLAEVTRLVALLGEPPHEVGEADTTLRAAAVGRPIEDVAELVTILGAEETGERALTGADRPVAARVVAPGSPAISPVAAATDGGSTTGRAREHTMDGPVTAPSVAAEPVAAEPVSGEPATARSFVAKSVGVAAVVTRPLTGAHPPALRSVLRWPAAVLLFGCGMIHLPTDFAGLRSVGTADVLALAITALCLVLGVWLAVRDTTLIWAASAATAVGIVAAHALSGSGGVNLLESSLGDSFIWARVVAVVCAAVAAVLSGSALIRREKPAGAVNGS